MRRRPPRIVVRTPPILPCEERFERPRLNLLNLSPSMQESVLLGDPHLSERRLGAVATEAVWARQGEFRSLDSRGRECVPRRKSFGYNGSCGLRVVFWRFRETFRGLVD